MDLRNATALVTGADGFIGSHLTERLVEVGARVRAFCLYNSNGSLGWLDGIDPAIRERLDVRLGDVRDARFVEAACEGVEYIFHLAALISIPYSYHAPESYVQTNVCGTLNVLEAARRQRPKRLIHTSTSEVYGTPDALPIRETHPLKAQSPYAATKVAADQLALSYHCSFGVPVAVLRPFNTFGPRQSTRAVMSTLLFQLLAGRREIQLGRLDPRRDLTYVSDTVEGFVKAATAEGLEGTTTQLGTGRSVSIAELFEVCRRVTGCDARVVQDPRRLRPDASEVLELLSDPALAAERLGWKAEVSLEEGIERTADWIRESPALFHSELLHV